MRPKTIVLTGVALALTGCAGLQLERAERAEATGSAFTQDLYGGYVDLSKAEFAEADYRDSDTFARRALISASGEAPEPETIQNRRLPEDRVGVLSAARTRLVAALDTGGREKFPDQAATAQVQFDCWMQEQEENFQPDDIAACQKGFILAIASLEDALKPEPVAAAPAPTPAPRPAPEPAMQSFMVMFDFDKATLTDATSDKLAEAAAFAAALDNAKIKVSGHADRAGSTVYNTKLSEMRAQTVVDALMKAGIEVTAIEMAAYGEYVTAVPTDDGVKSAENRRVEIVISE